MGMLDLPEHSNFQILALTFGDSDSKLSSEVFQGWCMGMTQKDVMGREVGGGFMFGNACKN